MPEENGADCAAFRRVQGGHVSPWMPYLLGGAGGIETAKSDSCKAPLVMYSRQGGRYDGTMAIKTIGSRLNKGWMIVALLSTVFVLTLTHLPHDVLPEALQQSLLDKVEHVMAYGMLMVCFALAFRQPVRPLSLMTAALALAVIGAFDEVTQPLFNRYASVADYASDLVGIAAVCGIFLVRRRPGLHTAGQSSRAGNGGHSAAPSDNG